MGRDVNDYMTRDCQVLVVVAHVYQTLVTVTHTNERITSCDKP